MSDTRLTFCGHTTILFSTGGIRFIFDPHLSEKNLWLKRQVQITPDIDELHQVNAILISNAHHNRLHPPSFRYFKQTAQVLMPLGLNRLIKDSYKFHISELKDGAQTTIGDCQIYALKALHRGYHKNGLSFSKSLNYLIKTPKLTLFYCSDTRYEGSYFYKIGKEFNVDIACLPVDRISPVPWTKKKYLNPAQALQAFKDLGAKQMIPVAYGAFSFRSNAQKRVSAALKKEIEKQGLGEKVFILKPGEKLQWDDGKANVVK